MKAIFKLIYIFVVTSCNVYSASIPKEEEVELFLVHVIFRHGARTTYSFYPTDPHQNETFYPFGLGGLTNEGKMGEYKLGAYLKKVYGDFLGEDYTEDKVYVRSTDVTRTKMSAQLVMAGLFPPSKIQLWNSDLLWQPIPVLYKTVEEEDIFHPNNEVCPYKAKQLNRQHNDSEAQEIFIKPYQDLFNYIEEKSRKPIQDPTHLQEFYAILKAESDMNLSLPEWTEKVYPEPLESISGLAYSYFNFDPEVRKINSGYMLEKILDDTEDKISNGNEKKIFLYSGHESTVGYMLNALDVYKVHVPPYGSAISFEIHKGKTQYYVKLRYRNSTEAMEPVDLIIPECDILCPLEKFRQLQYSLLPTISVKDACNGNFGNEGHLNKLQETEGNSA